MASPLFCPHITHLPARPRAYGAAIPSAAAGPGKKSPPASDAPVVLKIADPKRPWWAPLFLSAARRPGSDRTVIPEWVAAPAEKRSEDGEGTKGGPVNAGTPAGSRRSALTVEKARVLRRETRATETWHDAMYHSAIASRLASPDEQ